MDVSIKEISEPIPSAGQEIQCLIDKNGEIEKNIQQFSIARKTENAEVEEDKKIIFLNEDGSLADIVTYTAIGTLYKCNVYQKIIYVDNSPVYNILATESNRLRNDKLRLTAIINCKNPEKSTNLKRVAETNYWYKAYEKDGKKHFLYIHGNNIFKYENVRYCDAISTNLERHVVAVKLVDIVTEEIAFGFTRVMYNSYQEDDSDQLIRQIEYIFKIDDINKICGNLISEEDFEKLTLQGLYKENESFDQCDIRIGFKTNGLYADENMPALFLQSQLWRKGERLVDTIWNPSSSNEDDADEVFPNITNLNICK